MNIPKKRRDNLTVIDGIGPTRQEWLRSRLGIHTYQDLGELAAQTIVTGLKADGQIVSLKIVEAWCAAARDLAAQDPPADPSEWNPFTSFVVEFQVRQDNDEAKEYCTVAQLMELEIEQKWPGIETAQLCCWMREWIDKEMPIPAALPVSPPALPPAEPAPAEAPEASAVPEAMEAPAASAAPALAAQDVTSIEIQSIKLFQPPGAMQASAWCAPGGSFCGMLERDQPFSVRVSLKIASGDLSQLQQSGVECQLQLFSRCVPGGRILPLGDPVQFPIQGRQNEYVQAVPDLSLPAGTYHLKVLARIMLPTVAPAYQEARFLMVL